jgi:hypothetical protein
MKTFKKTLLAAALAMPIAAMADRLLVIWVKTDANQIRIVATDDPCSNPTMVAAGYPFVVISGIPLIRLKKPGDAYFIDNFYATTVMGCWSPKMRKAIWHRKHDGKEWKTDFRVDATWRRIVKDQAEELGAAVPDKPEPPKLTDGKT